eukprot:358415_1
MFDRVVCVIGYILIAGPTLYWVVQDLIHFRRHCKGVKKTKFKLSPSGLKQDDGFIGEDEEASMSQFMRNDELIKPIEKILSFSNIIMWFGLMISCYIGTRFIVSYFDYKRAYKYVANDVQDIEELCVRSFLIYVLGNIASRFQSDESKKLFLYLIIYFLITYTVTSEHCPNIELGGNGMVADAAT